MKNVRAQYEYIKSLNKLNKKSYWPSVFSAFVYMRKVKLLSRIKLIEQLT